MTSMNPGAPAELRRPSRRGKGDGIPSKKRMAGLGRARSTGDCDQFLDTHLGSRPKSDGRATLFLLLLKGEDVELAGAEKGEHHGDAENSVGDILFSHRSPKADPDGVRVLGFCAHESALAPEIVQEGLHQPTNRGPGRGLIGFEDKWLKRSFDRLADHDAGPTNADVTRFGIVAI